jgi:hypothetical protein
MQLWARSQAFYVPEKARMGELLAFPVPEKKSRRHKCSMAQILFFTGVRYERRNEPAVVVDEQTTGDDAPDRSSPSRRRKRRA